MSKALTQVQLHNIQTHPTVYCDYFEKIIDNKVNQVALSYLQQFIDWILTLLSQNYCELYTLKRVAIEHKTTSEDTQILRFRDGTMLIDLTKNKIVSIVLAKDLPGAQKDHERICFRGHEVYFHNNNDDATNDMIFGKKERNTQFAVVYDLLGPQWQIKESCLKNGRVLETLWTINSNRQDSDGALHCIRTKIDGGYSERDIFVPSAHLILK